MIKNSHTNNAPKGKIVKYISSGYRNNAGGFQGVPICAHLFIIYDDRVATKYTDELRNSNIINIKVLIKNSMINDNCTKYIFNEKDKTAEDNPIIRSFSDNLDIEEKLHDYTLYANDTNIEYKI